MDIDLHIWDLTKMKLHKKVREHNDTINCVSWAPNEKYVASGSFDGNTIIYAVDRDFEPHMTIPPQGWRTVYGAVFTGDSTQVCITADSTIRVFTVKQGEAVGEGDIEMKGHTKQVRCLAMTNDGKFLVSGAHDRTIRVWDWNTK